MSDIRIVDKTIAADEVKDIVKESLLDFVKAVVDVKREIMAVGGGMHADVERILLEGGSVQEDLWGVNIFPERPREQWIEFESLINIRPRQNRSMIIQDDEVRNKIKSIVAKLIS